MRESNRMSSPRAGNSLAAAAKQPIDKTRKYRRLVGRRPQIDPWSRMRGGGDLQTGSQHCWRPYRPGSRPSPNVVTPRESWPLRRWKRPGNSGRWRKNSRRPQNCRSRTTWRRYLAIPEGQDRNDRAAAFRLFGTVGQTARTSSPMRSVPHIQAASPARDDPVWLHNRGVEAFGRFRSTGDRLAIDQTVNLFRAAAAPT